MPDIFDVMIVKVFFRSNSEKNFQNLVQSEGAENHAVAGKRNVIISNELKIIIFKEIEQIS